MITLPPPRLSGPCGLESLLRLRRSTRAYAARPLTPAQAGQLLWAGQGVVAAEGRRTVPSAGAEYPLTLWLAVREVQGLQEGLYRYNPANHVLSLERNGALATALAEVALEEQPWLSAAPAVILVSGDAASIGYHFAEQPPKGQRGARYFAMETGAAAQNIALQATALGLGAVLVGGFDDEGLGRLLGLGEGEDPLAMLAVGPLSAVS